MSHSDNDLHEALLIKKAEECVQYILFCYLSQHKIIVRKTDLTKNVITNKDHTRFFRNIFKLVIKYLNDIFGLILVPLDNGTKYGIRNKFEYDSDLNKCGMETSSLRINTDSVSSLNETDIEFQEQFKYSMLMISLSLIFMNGNEIEGDIFWQSLKKLDIHKDEKRHKYLGDVYKYFTTELVKDTYLEHEQVKGIEPPTFKFRWGQRAKLEISKKSVLDFVCEIYGGVDTCKPEEWIAQYAEAMQPDEVNSNETVESPPTTTQQTSTQHHNDSDEENHGNGTQTRFSSRRSLMSTPSRSSRR